MYLSVGVMWSCSYWRLSCWHVNVAVSVRVWYKMHWWRLGRRCAVLSRRAVLTGCHTRWQWRRRRMGRTLLYRLPLSLSLKHSKSSHTISKWTDWWIDGWMEGWMDCWELHFSTQTAAETVYTQSYPAPITMTISTLLFIFNSQLRTVTYENWNMFCCPCNN